MIRHDIKIVNPPASTRWARTYRLRFPYADPSPFPSCDIDVVSLIPELDEWITRIFSPCLRGVVPRENPVSDNGALFRISRDAPKDGESRGRLRLQHPGGRSVSSKRPVRMACKLEYWMFEHLSWNLRGYSQIHATFADKGTGGVLMPGRTHIGKTTLALTLWQSGWSIYADDMAFIQPESGLFIPFPRPFNLRKETLDMLRAPALGCELRMGPPDYSEISAYFHPAWVPPAPGRDALPKPVQARWIVFPRRRERARKKPELRPLTRGQALRRLVPHAYATHEFGVRGLEILSDLVSRTEPYELVLGLPEENCRLIDEVLGGG